MLTTLRWVAVALTSTIAELVFQSSFSPRILRSLTYVTNPGGERELFSFRNPVGQFTQRPIASDQLVSHRLCSRHWRSQWTDTLETVSFKPEACILSTMDIESALHNIVSSYELSLEAKQFAIGFTDISGASYYITFYYLRHGIESGIIFSTDDN